MKKNIKIVTKIKQYIYCDNCKQYFISLHVHDWRACNCFENELDNKGGYIDGGDNYSRIRMPKNGRIGIGEFEINYNTGAYKFIKDVNKDK